MKIKNHIKLGRLVGKIDNDFNISESDWIPRVAAWTIDALAQMKCLPMERKRKVLEVSDRIAQWPCDMTMEELKVFDKNGCEVYPLNKLDYCCGQQLKVNFVEQELQVIDDSNKSGVNFMKTVTINNSSVNKGFVIQGNCIELTFDTDEIIVETYAVATYYDEYYDCDIPYIYDDGLLLEALAWYCLFKYLSRGSHHPVYSLTSPNQVINPWIQWNSLRPRAAASVKIKIGRELDGWNSFFFNSTFRPRS